MRVEDVPPSAIQSQTPLSVTLVGELALFHGPPDRVVGDPQSFASGAFLISEMRLAFTRFVPFDTAPHRWIVG